RRVPEQRQVEERQGPEEQRRDARVPEELPTDAAEQRPAEALGGRPKEQVGGPSLAGGDRQGRKLLLHGGPLVHRARSTPRSHVRQSQLLQREWHAAIAAADFLRDAGETRRTGHRLAGGYPALLRHRGSDVARFAATAGVADQAERGCPAPRTRRRLRRRRRRLTEVIQARVFHVSDRFGLEGEIGGCGLG